jgi:hypothetical protein
VSDHAEMEDSDHDAGNHGKLGREQDYPDFRCRQNSNVLFHDVAEGVEAIRRSTECVSTFDNTFANVGPFRNLLRQHTICAMGHVRDLPASAERAIHIDEVCRDLRVAVGKVIFALQQLGLCRVDIQEVGRALRVTLPGGLQSGLVFRDGAGDVDAPALRFSKVRQGVVDLLPSPQNRFPEEDGCFPLS